jgi:hypothetical protein
MRERFAATKILQKVIALVLLPVPAALLLLFTAGSFILMILSSLCAVTASIVVLSVVVLVVTHAAITVHTILMGLGIVILLMLFSVGITLGKDTIEFFLMKAVQYLVRVLIDPLNNGMKGKQL